MRLPLVSLVVITAIVLGLQPLQLSTAQAATLSVCASGCPYTTIRDAIDAAQTGDTISIAPGTYLENLTIPGSGTATQLRLQKGLGGGLFAGFPGIPNFPTIPWFSNAGGGDVIIDGGGAGSVLSVGLGSTVELVDLTLTNGNAEGGGIYNQGTLRLSRVKVTGNQGGPEIGGIYNLSTGTLEARDSEVSANSASDDIGGILNEGTMSLTNVIVRDNTASSGGGILNTGTLTLRAVQVRGNDTVAQGGGIENAGTLTGSAVEVSGNTAGDVGGGILNDNTGTLTLTNSFVRDNTGTTSGGLGGGGIAQLSSGAVTLTNTLITGNTGTQGGGLYLATNRSATLRSSVVSRNTATGTGGGIYAEAGVTLSRQATAIFLNTPDNCAGAVSC
ncbi:MAG: hypothetical protein AB7R89_11950 [Dehalococcoidia bacterium]